MTDDQFAWWLAGFCDGEAHFTVSLARSTSGRVSGSPRFNLTLREDDYAVLQQAQARLGVGRLCKLSRATRRAAGGRDRDAVAWDVTGPSCAVVARVLDGKMQSKKARELAIWGPAVEASAAMPRYDSRRAPLLLDLRENLMALRCEES